MSSALTSPNLVAARSMISPASKAPRADDLMTYLTRAALKPNQAIRGNQGARLVPDEGGT
eukprot:jgi/Chrpa1/11537/Chrysochromulina_OHIO_Genome00021495-RA